MFELIDIETIILFHNKFFHFCDPLFRPLYSCTRALVKINEFDDLFFKVRLCLNFLSNLDELPKSDPRIESEHLLEKCQALTRKGNLQNPTGQ